MEILFHCPKCGGKVKENGVEEKTGLNCPSCKKEFPLRHFPDADRRELRQCPLCESKDLYLQKKFPKALGLSIVGAAIVATLLWDTRYYSPLIISAILDAILYKLCPTISKCYRCHAEYSDFIKLDDREYFDLNIHERYRHSKFGSKGPGY